MTKLSNTTKLSLLILAAALNGCVLSDDFSIAPTADRLPAGPGGSGGTVTAGTAGMGGTGGTGPGGSAGTGGSGALAGSAGTGGSGGTAGSVAGSGGSGGSSGTAGSGGSGGSGGTAGAGGSAPECEPDTLGCFSDQPKVCLDGHWQDSGGTCTYSCGAGKCDCSAPGRFTKLSNIWFKDNDTGLQWVPISGGVNVPDAEVFCLSSLGGAHLPTKAQMLDILAQQSNAIFCSPNVDPVIDEMLTGYKSDPDHTVYTGPSWTKDVVNGNQVTVIIKTGEVGSMDPNMVNDALFFCVK